MQQQALMKFDPATGAETPYPSHAAQWREWHGKMTAWLFNPWTGQRRDARDVGSDVQGLLIVLPDETVFAANNRMAANRAELLAEDIECLHKCLDEAGVPRAGQSGASFSMWGRVIRFRDMSSNAQVQPPSAEGAKVALQPLVGQ